MPTERRGSAKATQKLPVSPILLCSCPTLMESLDTVFQSLKETLSFLATNLAFIANMIMALHYMDLWPSGFQSVLQTSADTWPMYTGTTEMCSASKTTCHKCLAKHRSSSHYFRPGYGECFALLNLNGKEEYNYVSRYSVALTSSALHLLLNSYCSAL